MQQVILTNKTCWWNLLLWHNHAWGTLGFELIYQAWDIISSSDETLRRELKIQCALEYFWQTSRCFIWWWNTVLNAWYYFSNKMILEGEIKDAKLNSFSSDFQTLIKHSLHFLCIFFMNYWWVWEDYFFVSKECIMIIVVTKKFTKWTLK